MTDSPYQLNIYNELRNGTSNIFVDAKAGSGKTTTIVRALSFLPVRRPGEITALSIRFLAFNKSIAETLKSRVPSHVVCSTFHSLGLNALKSVIGRDFVVESRKVSKLVFNAVGRDCPDVQHIIKLVGLAKNWGVGTSIIEDTEGVWRALTDQFCIDLAEPGESIRVARSVLAASNRDLKQIDFDDMLYLPVLLNASFSPQDYLFVDEAQDTNAIQIEILVRSCYPTARSDDGTPLPIVESDGQVFNKYQNYRQTRLVFVGDPHQAIYGFRGSGTDSIEKLKTLFATKTMPLSVCYRCGHSIIREAQKTVSSILGWEESPEGEVRTLERYKPSDFRPGSVVLCRNVAPVVGLAYSLLQHDIPCIILGRDVGGALIALVRRMRAATLDDLRSKLRVWRDREVADAEAQGKSPERIDDQFQCLVFFIRGLDEDSQTVASLIAKIELMFTESADSRKVTLCSIHKAKGLEWDEVFILDRQLIPSRYATLPWQQTQEKNLRYVAQTRARLRLTYIESDKWEDNEPK